MAECLTDALIDVDELSLHRSADADDLTLLDRVSFRVGAGETLGIVGESGSGKSVTLRALMGILPDDMEVTGTVKLRDRHGRPARAAMVFQEPMTALNPTMRVGSFIAEAIRAADRTTGRAAQAEAVELMRMVGIPEPERRAHSWPHELSGGQRQRVMIAAAVARRPDVLLCDEPTTALDVTVQAQILDLIRRLAIERSMATVFVSHDLGVVADISDHIGVMYAGRLIEYGPTDEVLRRPSHPYTAGLLAATPSAVTDGGRLVSIPGSPPDPADYAAGCRFAPRCPVAVQACTSSRHQLAPHELSLTACIRPDRLVEDATW